MQHPYLSPLARALPDTVPFTGPEALERRSGIPFRARLGANESGFGPAPAVIEAIRAAAPETWRYGDPEIHDLKQALAARCAVPVANLVVGEGIDGLQGLIARLVISPGDAALTSLGTYPTFNYHVEGFGGRVLAIPYAGDRIDLDGLAAAAARERPKVVYLANPDNPMGGWHEPDALRAFLEAVSDDVLVLLDEAYCETAQAGALLPLDYTRPNLIRTRTFSKAYGLAGMRVGYAVGEPGFIRAFDKVRNHFGVTRLGQVAALAALGDEAWLHDVVARVAAGRQRIAAIGAGLGLAALPSATNFVALDCGRDGAFARAVLEALGRRGVFVRKPLAPGLDRCIRIAVGPPAELDVLAEELPHALDDAVAAARGTAA